MAAPSRLRALAKKLTVVAAAGYLVALLGAVLALRVVGDDWWVTSVAQYIPRLLLALPLPFLAIGLWILGQKKLVWTQIAAALVVVFPLMGLVLPGPTPRQSGAPVVRVLSQNVNSGFWGYDKILAEIVASSADVVLLQELSLINQPELFEEALKRHYVHVQRDGQFLLASRFPVLSTVLPEKVAFGETQRSARHVQHLIDTPLGKLSFFNVHPVSPRSAFYAFRGNSGLRRAILSGEVFAGPGKQAMMDHMGLLTAQLQDVSERAQREPHPVVIAGDLNLPTLNPTWHRFFSEFQDGFERAGSGFGYTFPNRDPPLRMWLRLDRIVASRDLDFVDFDVGCSSSSDHFCVVAELQRK